MKIAFLFLWLFICILWLCYCFAFSRAVKKYEKNKFTYGNEFTMPLVSTYRKLKRIIHAIKREWRDKQ